MRDGAKVAGAGRARDMSASAVEEAAMVAFEKVTGSLVVQKEFAMTECSDAETRNGLAGRLRVSALFYYTFAKRGPYLKTGHA